MFKTPSGFTVTLNSPKPSVTSSATSLKQKSRKISTKSTNATSSTNTIIESKEPSFITLCESGHLSPLVLKGIKYPKMTPIQDQTIHACLNGSDVLAQAKTGTGKTLAFLIPTIERILASPQSNKVSALIIAPTRDLAIQIDEEAKQLLKFLPSIRSLVVYGGTNKKMEQNVKEMDRVNPRLLVATPGRICDILQNSNDVDRYSNIDTFILDEADRLLDDGFLPSIRKIYKVISQWDESPTRQSTKKRPHDRLQQSSSSISRCRQSLLFSATISETVKNVGKLVLKPDHVFISTILETDSPTHELISQSVVISKVSDQYSVALYHILELFKIKNENKIICFLPTARMAQLCAELFKNLDNLPLTVLEVHSRMTASKREKSVQDFKKLDKAVIFSSDVLARGMDFPGVDLVIQIGIPSNKEQYLHRIGRTGRAGSSGGALLILTPEESPFLNEIKDLNVAKVEQPTSLPSTSLAMQQVSDETKSVAYQSWIGFYKGSMRLLRWSTTDLVERANHLALEGFECETIPGISKHTIGKMGLKGVPGLIIIDGDRKQNPGLVIIDGDRKQNHGGNGGRRMGTGGGGSSLRW